MTREGDDLAWDALYRWMARESPRDSPCAPPISPGTVNHPRPHCPAVWVDLGGRPFSSRLRRRAPCQRAA